MPSLAKIIDRLLQKLVRDPAGLGRPVPPEAFNEEYRSGRWAHLDGLEELPRQLVLAGLVSESHPCPAILDLGCGHGRLAQIVQPQPFSRYVGVDVSPEALRRAQARGLARVEWLEGDFEAWRPTGLFDAIIFNESIGYARDPAATLETFAAHLAPEGNFFLSYFRSGHYEALWRRLDRATLAAFATSVTSATAKTWDIKILRPRR